MGTGPCQTSPPPPPPYRQRQPPAMRRPTRVLLLAPSSLLTKEKFSILAEYAKQPHWLQAVKHNHHILVDGDSKIVRAASDESLFVSCCSYRADGSVDIKEALTNPWLV